MDILEKENGFTIIESLVTLIILGILTILTVIFFNKIYGNPELLLRREALTLADSEIHNIINNKVFTDTLYHNNKGNLTINRKIFDNKEYIYAVVTINFNQTQKQILSLDVCVRK